LDFDRKDKTNQRRLLTGVKWFPARSALEVVVGVVPVSGGDEEIANDARASAASSKT
jgi:hypothetical protein